MDIAPDIAAILGRATIDGRALCLPSERLDRKTYERVNKVIEGLGGVWNRKAQAHLFDADPAVSLAAALGTGKVTSVRERIQAEGWFPTPPDIAARVVELAEILDGHHILEPSCGEGALIAAVLVTSKPASILGIERDVGRAQKCRVFSRMRKPTIEILGCDFLDFKTGDLALADRIVMNPPFRNGDDARHVTHALKFLKPGGRLVSVMAAGIKFRNTEPFRSLRKIVDAFGEIEDLPSGSFSDAGTAVETVLVVIDV